MDSWVGRSPGEGNSSCLENPMDRGTWWATVQRVTRVQSGLAIKPPPPPTHYKNTYIDVCVYRYMCVDRRVNILSPILSLLNFHSSSLKHLQPSKSQAGEKVSVCVFCEQPNGSPHRKKLRPPANSQKVTAASCQQSRR